MRALLLKLGQFSVVAALAVALTAVGFAHRTAPQPMTPELADYIAAGGLLSDLCVTPNGETRGTVAECEACRVISATLALAPERMCLAKTEKTLTYAFVAKRIAERNDLDPTRLSRAPPRA